MGTSGSGLKSLRYISIPGEKIKNIQKKNFEID